MRHQISLTPNLKKILSITGEQIKLARLRRNLTSTLVCTRAEISRPTLLKVEKGSEDVAIGIYIRVLQAIGGLEKDILKIAADDKVGRTFQDLHLRAPKRGKI